MSTGGAVGPASHYIGYPQAQIRRKGHVPGLPASHGRLSHETVAGRRVLLQGVSGLLVGTSTGR